MPRIDGPEKVIPAESIRPVKRYELGLVAFGERVLVCIDLETADGTRTYAMSLASAVTFAGDLQAMIESDHGIAALVRETLADARAMKRDAGELPADQRPAPRAGLPGIALGIMGDGGTLWCCSAAEGCGICRAGEEA